MSRYDAYAKCADWPRFITQPRQNEIRIEREWVRGQKAFARAFVYGGMYGNLKVSVERAQNLPQASAYVVGVRLGASEERTTSAVGGTKNPVWKESVEFEMPKQSGLKLHFRVMEEGSGNVVGTTELDPATSARQHVHLTLKEHKASQLTVEIEVGESSVMDEVKHFGSRSSRRLLPTLVQLANAGTLPGAVAPVIGLPDMHCGYGFAIGSVCAINTEDPHAVVSPGGVGFDINCGVRLIRTNLFAEDLKDKKDHLVQSLYDHIPVGLGSMGVLPTSFDTLTKALELGMDWSVREGQAWVEDRDHCEEYGRMLDVDPAVCSTRAKKRGMPQMGTLGAGNHFAEVQTVDRVFDTHAAKRMGLEEGQVVVMVHSGSRGFGHQVATDSLVELERVISRDGVQLNDMQLAHTKIDSPEGQRYLKGMGCAANYAWVNRSAITFLVRQAFSKVFGSPADDLDMHLIYDVSHNIAKFEQHLVDGKPRRLLVHRKGATRAFPPHHPDIPVDYQNIGQPVLLGGSMGTSSWVLTGTEKAMTHSWGSTCHGSGRALARNNARNTVDHTSVLMDLQSQEITCRVASLKLLNEEAPDAYKDVDQVVETCHTAGICKKTARLRPQCVIKG